MAVENPREHHDDIPPAPDGTVPLLPVEERPTAEQVTYTFPVRIEVAGVLSEEHLGAVADHVLEEIDTALRGRT